MAKIAFIIPSYQREDLLKECLSSLLSQDYQEWEAYIIDDASTCDIKETVESFSDNRFKYIRLEENHGPAYCRNYAISLIESEYISFLDSDDKLDPTFISYLLKKMEENDAQIGISSFSIFNEKKENKFPLRFSSKLLSKEEAIKRLLNDISIRGFLWGKIFKSSLFKGNPSVQIKSRHLFEDAPICLSLFSKADRIYYSKKPIYKYRKGDESSLSSQKEISRARQHLESFLLMKAYIDSLKDPSLSKLIKKSYFRCKLSLDYDLSRSKKAGLGKIEAKVIKKELKLLKTDEPINLDAYPFIKESLMC